MAGRGKRSATKGGEGSGAPDLSHERALGGVVAGVDEAGCAPLAGPVVAAAVILPEDADHDPDFAGLTDSKLMTVEARERAAAVIEARAIVGIGAASNVEIDRINIYRANMLAMARAVAALAVRPDHALVDGNRKPEMPCAVMTLVGGDRLALSVSAASVVAKVTRDRAMAQLCPRYPDYGWSGNAGYPTVTHMMGLLLKGPSPHHRRSFQPLVDWYGGLIVMPRYRLLRSPRLTPRQRADVDLVPVRADLWAVTVGTRSLVGVLRKRRVLAGGGWSFVSVGEGEDERACLGGGPCAGLHTRPIAAPDRSSVMALLAGAA